MIHSKIILFISSLVSFNAFSSNTIEFNISKKYNAEITTAGQEGDYEVKYKIFEKTRLMKEKIIHIDSEKKIKILIDDFNFDGRKDFSIWHTDEGMGTYKIFRIFIFTDKNHDFNEIHSPCGDDYIDVRVDKQKKELISSYFDDNQVKKCITVKRNIMMK